MAGIEMKPGRAFSFMTGVALLGAIAKFNEMTPAAQASWLGSAAETARTAQSWLQNAVVTYGDLAGKTAPDPAAQQPPERRSTPTSPPNPNASQPPASAREGRESQGAPSQRVAVQTGDAELRAAAGNPLWVLPLKQLSSTRDRPIFSPSRRPPPAPTLVAPVAVRQPVKPAEPERPAISLLGTIIGIDDRIGVFLETGTQNILRLRVGDDHQGWILRLIKAREVTLVKDHEQVAVLDLPPPGEAPGGMPMPGMGGIPAMGGAIPGMGTPVTGGIPVRGAMPGTVPVPGAVPANQRPQQQQPQQQSRRQGR
jgi:hypothetical protein